MTALPRRPVAWYGDDFTGSTDVLEVLAGAGLPAVLFLRPPSAERLAAHAAARALGIAGEARSRPPQWMDRHLPEAFAALGAFGARLHHYKVCSTFDSSPGTGSIGRALDLGRAQLGGEPAVPIVVGAPALRRYCAFGNLFAAAGKEVARLDRHPTMSRHPVTPMAEADLRRHLAAQTAARVALFDLEALGADDYRERFERLLGERPDAVLIDVMDARTLERCGELVWEQMPAARFAVASSGLEYALVAWWRAAGLIGEPPDMASPPVDRMAVVSGSCSIATAEQVRFAARAGWATIAADATRLADAATRDAECERLERLGLEALGAGRSLIVHTALGPDDERVLRFGQWLDASGGMREAANAAIGNALGTLLRSLVARATLERVAVAGGDTSSAAGAALGIDAVTMIAPTAPGSPLCLAHSSDRAVQGIGIVFKGGQVGREDYFESVRRGHAVRRLEKHHGRSACMQ